MVYIGTAAWNIPANAKNFFPEEGSHLERYARGLNAVEINTSFYRDHLPKSYERWRECVPVNFSFSVKVSRQFTHTMGLDVHPEMQKENIRDILNLGNKLKVLLVQLPPSLVFKNAVARRFFGTLREIYNAAIVCEPRHITWNSLEAKKCFSDFRISKVVADPEPCPVDYVGDWQLGETVYLRLHGSPEIYKSSYSLGFLCKTMSEIDLWKHEKSVWCIFDNTTIGHATENALDLMRLIKESSLSSCSFGQSGFDSRHE